MRGFVGRIRSGQEEASVVKALSLLAAVYGIYTITENAGHFVQVTTTYSLFQFVSVLYSLV